LSERAGRDRAFALAVTASGALRRYETTPLRTVDQGISARKRAEQVRAVYTPPVSISLVVQPVRT
jgi:hypothetical protein